MLSNIKDRIINMKEVIGDKASELAEEFSYTDKIKDFSLNAVDIVTQIDAHLLQKQANYEVSEFKISGSIGISGGLALDIKFSKISGVIDNLQE